MVGKWQVWKFQRRDQQRLQQRREERTDDVEKRAGKEDDSLLGQLHGGESEDLAVHPTGKRVLKGEEYSGP